MYVFFPSSDQVQQKGCFLSIFFSYCWWSKYKLKGWLIYIFYYVKMISASIWQQDLDTTDPTLRPKQNKIWNVESESILCLEGISTHLYVLLDISRWDQVDVCSHCSPRYLDGIKLLQRGGGGRVGRGCWGRGQLLVIWRNIPQKCWQTVKKI